MPRADRSAQAASPASLPGLGPRSLDMLAAAGIRSLDQLRRLGSVKAYARVKACEPRASLNLLWALEGALTDEPWRVVARVHRTRLLMALEDLGRPDASRAPGRRP